MPHTPKASPTEQDLNNMSEEELFNQVINQLSVKDEKIDSLLEMIKTRLVPLEMSAVSMDDLKKDLIKIQNENHILKSKLNKLEELEAKLEKEKPYEECKKLQAENQNLSAEIKQQEDELSKTKANYEKKLTDKKIEYETQMEAMEKKYNTLKLGIFALQKKIQNHNTTEYANPKTVADSFRDGVNALAAKQEKVSSASSLVRKGMNIIDDLLSDDNSEIKPSSPSN